MTFSPAACKALAFASTARVADSWIAAMRAEIRDAEVATTPWWHVTAARPEPFPPRAALREPAPPSLAAHAPPLPPRRVRPRGDGGRGPRRRIRQPRRHRDRGGRGPPIAQGGHRRRRGDRADLDRRQHSHGTAPREHGEDH